MYPRPFEYARPSTVAEATGLLASNEHAKVLAGGQSLIPLLKLRLVSPALVVDISGITGLDRIERDGGELVIGPLATHHAVAADPLVAMHAGALARAAAIVGDPQVRNRGTIGGSLCHGDSVADEPAAAIALAAVLVLEGPDTRRSVTADEFFVDTLTTAAGENEILTEIRIPVAEGSQSVYRKIGRRGPDRDYPVVGVAGARNVDGRVRLALTGAATRPRYLAEASELASDPGAAADAAASEFTIVGDIYGSVDYKRHLVTVEVARVLRALAGH